MLEKLPLPSVRRFPPAASLIALALWTSSLLSTAAPPVVPSSARTNAQQRVDYGYTPGLIIGMINADGRTIKSFGARSWDDATPPDKNTIYEIGSITKVFTTVLLAEMVEADEVRLTDTVARLLPGIRLPRSGGNRITLEHLATHRSGLPRDAPNMIDENTDFTNPFAGYTEAKLYEFLEGHVMARLPGSQFEYSNVGIGLLGHVLAKQKNMSWETLLQERVLTPLGLGDTTLDLGEEQQERSVPGHSGVVVRPPFKMDELAPAGELRSTVDDLLTFLEHNIGLVQSPLRAPLQNSHRRRNSSDSPQYAIGLGWWLWGANATIVQHGGATMGQTASIAFDKESRTGVVVLTNARTNQYTGVLELSLHCLNQAVPLPVIRRPATIDERTLRRYVGRYQWNQFYFDITLEQGRLVSTYSNDRVPITAYPTGGHDFEFPDIPGSTASFTLDPRTRRVNNFRWNQPGFSEIFSRLLRPPKLLLSRSGREIVLGVNGEGDLDYHLQEFDDFTKTWETTQKLSIWEPPHREPIDEGARLFRLIEDTP